MTAAKASCDPGWSRHLTRPLTGAPQAALAAPGKDAEKPLRRAGVSCLRMMA